jgi:hypothetical protein
MHMRHYIVRACALVMIVALAGCAGHKPREPELELPPGIEEAPGGLKFSVKITPTTFKLGQRVVLEATMFNDSDKKFEQQFPTACVFDYEIAANARVLGPSRMCAQAVTDVVLEPGELRMIMREWSGNDRYFDANDPLEPGIYQVTAGLVEGGRVVPMADPVTIEIQPR